MPHHEFPDITGPKIARSDFIATTEQMDLSWFEGIQSSDSLDISAPIEDALRSLFHRSAGTPAGKICNSSTTTGTPRGKGSITDSKAQLAHRPRSAQRGKRSALSKEQLTRKQKHDREAQRNMRQRRKEHIENLERKVKDLEEGMEAVLASNRELEKKVKDLEENPWADTELAAYSRGTEYGIYQTQPNWQYV